MDQKTFDELMENEELSLILMDGSMELTKDQMDLVKKKSKKIAEEKLLKFAEELSGKPGLNDFLSMPIISSLVGGKFKKTNDGVTNIGIKPKKTNKDPNFFSGSTSTIAPLIVRDSESNILGKIYNFMRMEHNLYMKNIVKDVKNRKKIEKIKENRNQQLIDIFSGKKGKIKKKPKTEPVPKEEPTVEPKAKPKVEPTVKKVEPKTKPTIIGGAVSAGAAAGLGLLPLLSKAESSDYNQLVIPKKNTNAPSKANLTEMTIDEVLTFQKQMTDSKKYPSSAVGKYQIIRDTLLEAVKKLKIPLSDKFDVTTQDRIYYEFLTGSKRKNLSNYITGKVPKTEENLIAAQLDMAKEFASVGVPIPLKSHQDGTWPKHDLKVGDSYYSGAGGNRASVSAEKSAKAINEERDLRTNTPSMSKSPVRNITGDKLDSTTSEYNSLSDQSSIQQNNLTSLNNTMIIRDGDTLYQNPETVDNSDSALSRVYR